VAINKKFNVGGGRGYFNHESVITWQLFQNKLEKLKEKKSEKWNKNGLATLL
jgi:hypothetical protein